MMAAQVTKVNTTQNMMQLRTRLTIDGQPSSPQQKRLIITKLFKGIQLDNDVLSVNYTEFAQAIAQNVLETRKIIGGKNDKPNYENRPHQQR